jgi:hypothetical protein
MKKDSSMEPKKISVQSRIRAGEFRELVSNHSIHSMKQFMENIVSLYDVVSLYD